MLKRLRGMFSNDLSIDLGTANTLIYIHDKLMKQIHYYQDRFIFIQFLILYLIN